MSRLRRVWAELARWNWFFILAWSGLIALGVFSWRVVWGLL